ncbi:hypothetical protein ACLOJK_000678 [Asimina triloba]
MDAYEATKIVFSRIQTLDPENAAKIMGLLLIQDHGEKEMIRLAFGPEALLQSLVLKAKQDLGLLPPSTTPSTPSTPPSPSPFLSSSRAPLQNSSSSSSSSRWLTTSISLPHSLSLSSPTCWGAPAFPRSGGGASDDLQPAAADELISPHSSYSINGMNMGVAAVSSASAASSSAFYGDHLMDEFQLQDQLSFLNDTGASNSLHPASLAKTAGDLFYPDADGAAAAAAGGHDGGVLLPYGNWGTNGHHRRAFSVTDVCLGSDAAAAAGAAGFGWKPCLYFQRGYCKNGTSCRFLHGLPDSPTAAADVGMDAPCQELLLRSKSQRLSSSPSHLMASASFPYSSGVVSKCMNYLLQQQQQQQNETTHRAAAAALMLGDEHKFGRSRMERNEFGVVGGMVNPGSRQIYLTFPADSTFREEDVSNYFSIYGPVQDVRIPYQQKRMFGFVTFVYPETVKLILAKGNPHFVCDARVLVKPYKEKGKVPDKKQQQTQGVRMFYNSHDVLMNKLDEQADLQQAIELQGRRLMGLQLLDVKRRNLSSQLPSPSPDHHHHHFNAIPIPIPIPSSDRRSSPEAPPLSQENCQSPATSGTPVTVDHHHHHHQLQQFQLKQQQQLEPNGSTANDIATVESLKEDSDFQESNVEHNLPDNPFSSPTKSMGDAPSFFLDQSGSGGSTNSSSISSSNSSSPVTSSSLYPASSTLDMASFKSCYFQLPRSQSFLHSPTF